MRKEKQGEGCAEVMGLELNAEIAKERKGLMLVHVFARY